MNQTEYLQEYPKDNRQHKSSVFCKVFSEKKDLLDLYNALNGTDYADEDDLEINTIENVIYMTMKNDISFIIDCTLNLYEHQSTCNPNMPLRGLLYFRSCIISISSRMAWIFSAKLYRKSRFHAMLYFTMAQTSSRIKPS